MPTVHALQLPPRQVHIRSRMSVVVGYMKTFEETL